MCNIAILDDEKQIIGELSGYFKTYSEQSGRKFGISTYTDSLKFLSSFSRGKYDAVFLDIEMPVLDGMKTAERIRALDEDVVIVFVTNMAQYAIQGYSVQAYRFLVKPIFYNDFSTVLAQIMTKLSKRVYDKYITVTSAGKQERLCIQDLYYVEIYGHKIKYHYSGGIIESWGTMKAVAAELEKFDFVRSNVCYLVNLKYVKMIDGYELVLTDGTKLAVSHSKKKEFMQKMAAFLGR